MDTTPKLYHGYRFPGEIISHAVWLYHRFALSFRNVEEILAYRGIEVTYESVRQWCMHFGPGYAKKIRARHPRPGDTWHLDEVSLSETSSGPESASSSALAKLISVDRQSDFSGQTE